MDSKFTIAILRQKEKNMNDINYLLEECKHCGNKGLLKIVGKHHQSFTDYADGEPVFQQYTDWTMVECPVCKGISLHKSYSNDTMFDAEGGYFTEETIEYPESKYSFVHVPDGILKSYNAAAKTVNVDLNVSLIAIRAVLEKICKERGSKKKNLEAMLKEMVSKNILPETLDKCSFLIRKLGNSGAHGDENEELSKADVYALPDFIETILYYIYELPVKITRLNKKYVGQEQNNKTI